MRRPPHVQVTLSNELLQHLRKAACQQHVPLCWLVTGLICDTLEKGAGTPANPPMSTPRPLQRRRNADARPPFTAARP